MIWILATRGAATKLRTSPFTETPIAGVHSVVYRPGVIPVPGSGSDAGGAPLGTFDRGLHRVSGFVLSYDGTAAETLLGIEEEIDLLIRYRASGEKRIRTLVEVVFIGDTEVSFPSLNAGVPALIAVPFRLQIAEGQKLSDHVFDAEET